ncbi:MAG: helix-turn-helix domain-containing protein [Aggregatilineales bacterium]
MASTHEATSYCPIEYTLNVIGGKWKPLIIYFLLDNPKRISQLQRLIPDASRRMLTKHLRELEEDGIVYREIYPQIPPKVEYSLTGRGRSLEPILLSMLAWANENQNDNQKPNQNEGQAVNERVLESR